MMVKKLVKCLVFLSVALEVLSAEEIAPCPHCTKAPTDSKELEGLDIALISENLSIKLGRSFRVALKIEHKAGFHTYWRNPGVVGVPTQMNWKLPKGFTAKPIQWPYPELSKMASYPCFGYERDVLLMMEITPPIEWDEETVTIEGQGQWMCCSNLCYPGYEPFSITLGVGDEITSLEYAPLFEKAEKELPQLQGKFSHKMLTQIDEQSIQLMITSEDPNLQVIRVFNADGQTTPDLNHGLKQISHNEFLFIAERSKYSPKNKEVFPVVIETNQGFYSFLSPYVTASTQ